MRKSPKANLEMALIADGVSPDEVYDVLEHRGRRRSAFAKLDTIKDEVVWWEAGAQPPQLLADGEVVMTTAYNGRIFNAAIGEGQAFEIVWDGQVLDSTSGRSRRVRRTWRTPWTSWCSRPRPSSLPRRRAGSPTARPASRPVRWSAPINDGKTEMGPHMPTAEANMETAIVTNSSSGPTTRTSWTSASAPGSLSSHKGRAGRCVDATGCGGRACRYIHPPPAGPVRRRTEGRSNQIMAAMIR